MEATTIFMWLIISIVVFILIAMMGPGAIVLLFGGVGAYILFTSQG